MENKYEIIKRKTQKYFQYKNRAKAKEIHFSLTLPEFIQLTTAHCYICGVSGDEVDLGVDRLRNNSGYIFFNVAPCCFICNRAKNDMPFTEFKKWLKRINPNHRLCKDTKVDFSQLQNKKILKKFIPSSNGNSQ